MHNCFNSLYGCVYKTDKLSYVRKHLFDCKFNPCDNRKTHGCDFIGSNEEVENHSENCEFNDNEYNNVTEDNRNVVEEEVDKISEENENLKKKIIQQQIEVVTLQNQIKDLKGEVDKFQSQFSTLSETLTKLINPKIQQEK
eukprot:TRINITY_DN2914_c1_g1_i1.p1 TRINITY_DN2914_c1_g1~~TRINITY_DN2914_c1_g1_i1.p1  ORF type:complete len:141 (+),score=42.71 TRINITY_DN2914_c1_g1_i1:41-463(+)